ncbi:MAG: TfoX/Sxy family protein [Burkholderiales bacterium]|nr:TfoX/Sxy family protein [Burkholderiales bacterium]
MTTWKKVPADLAAAFDAALPSAVDVERRKMFGCPAAFVNGNLFAGLHEDRLMIRLPAEAAARPCVLLGRTMREYALFADAPEMAPRDMAGWIRRAYDFTRALPAKAAKPRAAAGAAAAAAAAAKASPEKAATKPATAKRPTANHPAAKATRPGKRTPTR